MKYVDDTYLLVGLNNIGSAQIELQHMQAWATSKNLHINPLKTWEMAVVRRSQASLASMPSITGVTRATSIKILGVTIGERLTVSEHVDRTSMLLLLLTLCSASVASSWYPGQALHVVTRATTIARLLYASPAWWGLMSAGEVDRIERFLGRVKRAGFLPLDAPTANSMAEVADAALFAAVIRDRDHVFVSSFKSGLSANIICALGLIHLNLLVRTIRVSYHVCCLKMFTRLNLPIS